MTPFSFSLKLNSTYVDIAFFGLGTLLLLGFLKAVRRHIKTTKLPAPRSPSWLFGFSKAIALETTGDLFGDWYNELNASVYAMPGPFGSQDVVLMDPKAMQYFFANDTHGFSRSEFVRVASANVIGRGLLWSEGDIHKRQRKTLSPAFSPAALRKLQHFFYENAYKVKEKWEDLLSSSNEGVIDVQPWMGAITLDSLGMAGFAHDFGAIAGRRSSVKDMFDAIQPSVFTNASVMITALAQKFPILLNIPTRSKPLFGMVHDSMHEISQELLEKSRKEKEFAAEEGLDGEEGEWGIGWANRTIIGSLLKAENSASESHLTMDQALAQMKVLLLAGHETTSLALSWTLLQLALHPDKQERLRAELASLGGKDPTFEQIQNRLPYLEAVFREILRLYPPVASLSRVAAQDHTIPLSTPTRTRTGELVDHIKVAQGTSVIVPIRSVNRCEAFWGEDAKRFMPERWLELSAKNGQTVGLRSSGEGGAGEQGPGGQNGRAESHGHGRGRAHELQGFHHLLTFGDGPRMCIGRHFAAIQFKSVIAVLIRYYAFSLRDGPETKLETVTAVFSRPRVAGEQGLALPMRVRRID